MSEAEGVPRLSAEELAEIDRLVNNAPPSPEPDGPLPPLESDIAEWQEDRWRECASGTGGPRWRAGRVPLYESRSGLLRGWRSEDCVLQVWCRRELIAVVALHAGNYDLVTLVRQVGPGFDHETFPLALTRTHAVACPHPQGRHDLDSGKLLAEARKAAPGSPRAVRVHQVTVSV